ncbi:PREDICTED: UDP-N-acetylglucosamine transferase subunit ALG14 homolog [Branchiostoma belcheri]|uniref:UDP-N-acetylglucosamine transferase subunit ALG14 n=1 Tax=Branchiostoma belcheri TaxID=7741 RepID=A0A6P5AGH6_BRABE|nr:PREDICTED: UDP-N-acetylglucosamine transferase subunit ALG14 homolog [Branchiostoma belcheri]
MASVAVLAVWFVGLSAVLALLRLYFVFRGLGKDRNPTAASSGSIRTVVVVGSGGHTTEVLRLMSGLSDKYAPRYYIIAETDQMSEEKVHRFERETHPGKKDSYEIQKVPRSREVAQSWLSTVFTTLYATLYSFPMVFRISPDLILCNGPGTCIPPCAAGLLMTFLGLKKVSLVYVESICRVETLSLSAQLLYYLADHLLVQWPHLQQKFPRTTYIGRVI